ncbi:hypothetical protein EVA_07446 [gut metagenome]|uniref:Uncharacterized protein n=1 Tax=gut metagenome TaxID=749906 RepID=J9GC71_9ZZZZ
MMHVALFLLINLQNLFLGQNFAELTVILFTDIQHLTTLRKSVFQQFLNFGICQILLRYSGGRAIHSRCSPFQLAVHQTAVTQFCEVFFIHRHKLSSRSIIQHQPAYHLIHLHLHHLFRCRTLFFHSCLVVLSRQRTHISQKENGKYHIHNSHFHTHSI